MQAHTELNPMVFRIPPPPVAFHGQVPPGTPAVLWDIPISSLPSVLTLCHGMRAMEELGVVPTGLSRLLVSFPHGIFQALVATPPSFPHLAQKQPQLPGEAEKPFRH